MKKYLFLIIIIFFTSLQVKSQIIHFGAGTTFSRLEYKIYDRFGVVDFFKDPVVNYSFAAGIEYLEQKHFSITTGLNFYRTGGKFSQDELDKMRDKPENTGISLNYMSVNSTINFNPVNNKKFKLQLQLGPRFDYLVSKNADWPILGDNRYNFGITTGAGLYYKIRNLQLGLNAIHFGRKNIFHDNIDKVINRNNFNPYNPYMIPVTIEEKFWLLNISVGYRLGKTNENIAG